MKYWLIFALLYSTLPSMAADTPLNFSKHPPGKTPKGFRASGGGANEWKVIEAELPSTLDPNLIVKRHCLRHKGGKNDPDRYPTLIFEGPDYADFTLKTSFRIDGGNGVQAAGVVFRAKRDHPFMLLAIIPEKNRMYLKFCEKDIKPAGPESDIESPQDGWYHLELTCRNNQISGRLNGRTFPARQLNDMPPGRVGFWARGDTDCLFTMSSVTLPTSFAQSVLNEVAQANKHLQRVELVAIRVGKIYPEVAAATDLKQVGQPAHASCRHTIENGAEIYSESPDAIEVIVPVKNVDGDIMAAARVFLNPSKFTTRAKHRARASAVAIELGKKIQTHTKLFR